MKKIKYLIIILLITLTTTGCFKRDNMDNINIITTTYPIEHLIDVIYGYNSSIKSIYPSGVSTTEYSLTNKKINEYATADVFIYNGLTEEKNIAAQLLNKNSQLKIIDVSKGISIQRKADELWLSPSNYLMLAQNIKNELSSFISSSVVLQEIQDNYDALKLIISEYDAEFKLIADSSNKPYIVCGNDVFKFLEKYGFIVYSVLDNDNFIQSDYTNAKDLISKNQVSYIFLLESDRDNLDENTKKMIELGAKEIYIDSIPTRTDEQEETNYSYQDMMDNLIEQIKTEVYN